MASLMEIVQHEQFKFGNQKDVMNSIVTVIKVISGVEIKMFRNSPISNTAHQLYKIYRAKKVNKERFLKLDKTWLSMKEIEV